MTARLLPLRQIFDKPQDCCPSFADAQTAALTCLVGRFVAAAQDGVEDSVIRIGRAIERRIGGTHELNIMASFQDFMASGYNSLFFEHLALQDKVLAHAVTPQEQLKFYVMNAAMVVQERDAPTRTMQSSHALRCGW